MIKKILISFCIAVFISSSVNAAVDPQGKRRVEEQKRDDLKSTEVHASTKKTKKTDQRPLNDIDISYLAELSTKKVTFQYDLCKIIVLLNKVENRYITLDSQIEYLKENKFLPKNYQMQPRQPLSRGIAAYVLCRTLNIKGGLILRLFGTNQRYALKELAYLGILPDGNIQDIISGDEIVSAVLEATKYMEKQTLKGMRDE